MSGRVYCPGRRAFIKLCTATGLALTGMPAWPRLGAAELITKPIPATGERLPVIGMGTSRTFDVGSDPQARAVLLPVLQAFFDKGGAVIDSSPMYGSAEEVIGDLLQRVDNTGALFAATKVWTYGRQAGVEQMLRSQRRMGVERFDLMQIHNLRDWEVHLETLQEWKRRGRVRYIGITTSHGRFHPELERILDSKPFDFVQLSYNIGNRVAERRLLPLAAERGIAVLINRPFQRGDLFRQVKGRPLPEWATRFDCESWAQFFLKFVVSHPAVTCAIPATSKLHHMQDNMGAGFGRLPDADTRNRMIARYEST
ncbi:MAG: aldo/keto reductase [Gammaproteobacteria bacterium]|jgi:aryl-alcohol dehydrogenase-like predicted oxidoreductase